MAAFTTIKNYRTEDGSSIESYYNASGVACVRYVDVSGEVFSITKYVSIEACIKAFEDACDLAD